MQKRLNNIILSDIILGLEGGTYQKQLFDLQEVNTKNLNSYIVSKGVTLKLDKLNSIAYCDSKIMDLVNSLEDKEYIGFWIDKEFGSIYIDLVDILEDKEEAIKQAKKYNEIAIWDCKANQEIRIK